jgi:phosphate-selective porin OprO and OprP
MPFRQSPPGDSNLTGDPLRQRGEEIPCPTNLKMRTKRRHLLATLVMVLATGLPSAHCQELLPSGDRPMPLPPVLSPDPQVARRVSFEEPPSNDKVGARLFELEGLVKQQQSQVDALQEQLRIATTPPTPEAPKPYTVGSRLKMEGVWNNGLEFRSPNRDFYFHVGGRVQWDNVWLDSPNSTAALTNVGTNNDALQAASFFRRLRLRAEGSMYEVVDWCVEFNFAQYFLAQDPTQSAPQINGGFQNNTGTNISTAQSRLFDTAAATDLWWNFRAVPFFGNVQLGNEKEPFGLERLESSRYLDFLDRNLGNDAFISPSANGFAPGIMAWNWLPSKRGTYAYGVFKNVTNPYMYNVGDGQGEVAGRMTCLPWYDEPSGGRYFTHAGIGAASRAIDNGIITYRARGELRNGPDPLIPSWANTGPIGGHFQNIVNPEFMFQYGPLFVQSEFVANWTTDAVALTGTRGNVTNNQRLGTLYFYNAYLQVMYFLTGEHRIYDYQKGLVGRVIPFSNAFWVRDENGRIFGPGAWQIGARVDYLNFNNGGVQGGALTSLTVGLNWFFNPNMKAQFNFDTTSRDAAAAANSLSGGGTEGIIYGFGVRVAADF